jgi:hypothetical protein
MSTCSAVPVPMFGMRLVGGRCGIIGFARPNWQERRPVDVPGAIGRLDESMAIAAAIDLD